MTFHLPIYAKYSQHDQRDWVSEAPLYIDCKVLVDHIAFGTIDPPARILEIDEQAGTCVDVTRAVAIDVCIECMDDADEPREKLLDWLHGNSVVYAAFKERNDREEHGTL